MGRKPAERNAGGTAWVKTPRAARGRSRSSTASSPPGGDRLFQPWMRISPASSELGEPVHSAEIWAGKRALINPLGQGNIHHA